MPDSPWINGSLTIKPHLNCYDHDEPKLIEEIKVFNSRLELLNCKSIEKNANLNSFSNGLIQLHLYGFKLSEVTKKYIYFKHTCYQNKMINIRLI